MAGELDDSRVRPTAWRSGDEVTWEWAGKTQRGKVITTLNFLNGCQEVVIRLHDGRASVTNVQGWLLREAGLSSHP